MPEAVTDISTGLQLGFWPFSFFGGLISYGSLRGEWEAYGRTTRLWYFHLPAPLPAKNGPEVQFPA